MKKTIILSVALTGLLMGACRDPFHGCLHGNGHIVIEERNVSSFYKIESDGDYNVYIVQDTLTSVEVEAEENLLAYIQTRVDGNTLYIEDRDRRCIDYNEPVNVYLRTPSLEFIKLSGSGYIRFDTISSGFLKIDLSGSGDMEGVINTNILDARVSGSGEIFLSGSTGESDMLISGSGKIRSFSLAQDTCFASISGSGDMYVSVTDLLDVEISGSGDVFYMGNPLVNLSITGSGNVISSN
ncbi:MAG: head GIN domain-containing protein [Bacteroidota bacterium]